MFRQFKPDGSSGLFLPNGRPIDGIPIWRNVLDLEGDDITTPQLAVDGQIEHGQITDSLVDLELGPDRPYVFLPQWWLGSNQLSFVPRYSPGVGSKKLAWSCMVALLWLQRRATLPWVPEGNEIVSAFREQRPLSNFDERWT